jgi:hypothetical protein
MSQDQPHKCLSCKISAHADCVGEGCECACQTLDLTAHGDPPLPTRPDDLTHAQEDR